MNWSSPRRASVRWALLLLVGGALGFGLAWFGRTERAGDPTPVVVVTQTITPAGAPAVERTRRALLAAAADDDYEALRPFISDDFSYTFGSAVAGGAVAYWRNLERTTGERPLQTLAVLLKLPPVLAHGVYVWPWAYEVGAAGDLSEHERTLLAPLGSPEELFAGGSGYVGWRTGIRPDGTWAFFVAGD